MSSAGEGFKQMADFARPRNIKALRQAGAVHPMSSIAMLRTLPWLIGRGPSLGILTQAHAIALGDKIAIHDRRGSLTWRELDTRSNQAAHALWQSGLRGNDKVATLLRNGREALEVALGAQKYGIIACPLNTWAKPKELKATMAAADPGVIVYDTAHADQVKECAPEGVPLVFVGDSSKAIKGSIDYEDLIGDQPTKPPSPFTRDPGSPKVIIHTSGTTETPKGASRNASSAGIGALANLLQVVPYRRDDVVFCPAPLFHSFGLATFTFATALGSSMVLPEKFDPEESLRLIELHKATAASFVPVMIKRIVQLDDKVKNRYDLSSLRVVMASGSAMGEDLRKAAMEIFGDVLYDLYGSTEAGWVAIARPEDIKSRPKSVGKAVPGIEIQIFDKEGERIEGGETGEIFIKSELLFEGYTSGDAKDERDGYMSIGDLGHLDDDFLYIDGRADDMVVVGGENIYPIEIEEVIDGIEGVEDVTVMGIPDDEYGEVLAAFVVGSASEDEIKKVCKAELASYKVPKRIEKLDELPRTSTGKVLKRELVEIAEDSD
ncbi:MAG TPA: AMP-binding protein [Actinomycetota bacterium]|nr:AMP-binding protein [Actinomycetota bacterium]